MMGQGQDQLGPLGSGHPQFFCLLWRETLKSQVWHTPGMGYPWSAHDPRYSSSAGSLSQLRGLALPEWLGFRAPLPLQAYTS